MSQAKLFVIPRSGRRGSSLIFTAERSAHRPTLSYPGIPPGPDRPQAAVKGAIELRVAPQGVKAKWVRIEMRKIETLPGGGQNNVFVDFVGQSPVNVWQASEDYAMLHTQDFPFYIRIPDTIPPSLALEKGAGIKYELIATVCIKGKKGFFRRDKSIVLSTTAPIIIDKHELHSVWPLYQQPETRKFTQDGVTLTIDRNHTCYGPGDRVSVSATLKSDSLHTVILRGFEFTLKETTVFRAGPHATGKKAVPQVRVSVIGDQKVPVNATLYGGNQHKTELSCMIPSMHTSTTLNSARHIDITYILVVRALMGTGKPIIVDLPVMISNWPRNVSVEAIKRIGPTQALSLVHQGPTSQSSPQGVIVQTPANPQYPNTVSGVASRPAQEFDAGKQYTTLASTGQNGYGVDEFGYNRPAMSSSATKAGANAVQNSYGAGRRPGSPDGPNGNEASRMSISTSTSGPNARVAPSAQFAQRRFTVTNIDENDSPVSSDEHLEPEKKAPPPSTPPQNQWLTAEQEKQLLYERARAQAERTQTMAANPLAPMALPINLHQDAGPIMSSPGPVPKLANGWMPAEEEKQRLYNEATALAARTQGYASSLHNRTNSQGSHASMARTGSPQPGFPPAQSLYGQVPNGRSVGGSSAYPTPAPSTHSPPRTGPAALSSQPQYASAEQEKAMLRRYEEARAAVDRVQSYGGYEQEPVAGGSGAASTSDPIPYDALFPAPQNMAGSGAASVDMPPAFNVGKPYTSALDEKERARRYYEAQDAVARAQHPYANGGRHSPPPPAPTPSYSGSSQQPLSEKEVLRRKFEADDAAALRSGPPPQPPPRGAPPPPGSPPRGMNPRGGSGAGNSGLRSPLPVPGSPVPSSGFPGGFKPLTAAEEKARLKAQYEAEDRQSGASSSSGPPPSQYASIPPPPPLMPRPPKEYIQETQAANARSQQGHDLADVAGLSSATPQIDLTMRPFTPFTPGFDTVSPPPGPPPPLPPKVSAE
ncbi:hypothetical protein PUNSTDRAFT_135687 [Punctularia strigosozonata HHB-11173 SS5]|uniref:uncharacterized protein n=1 Tax=Punctularia strigosozonata (strain HHB-11173) TaxID=741275 RepID=UPI000441866E|nr:uncharacterized protein PUNSTDRAFT_135687 [Punctularia strigosozonata HHB-11173 SS5]EIN06986.1 hypothetical protein PUNSTDRAFT_135687 [Punctularia strigosozonata HHB-11173 SS5]